MSSRLRKCRDLQYWQGSRWLKIPEWALFLIRVGWYLGDIDLDDEVDRAVIAVSLPNRAFASGLAALGTVLAEPVPTPLEEEVETHFEKLLTLPDPKRTETGVTFLKNGRKLRGLFAGVQIIGGKRFIRVQVQAQGAYKSGGLTHFVGETEALSLSVESEHPRIVSQRFHGTAIFRHEQFVGRLYEPDEIPNLYLTAQCRTLIVGRLNTLHRETVSAPFAFLQGRAAAEGVMNDLLRVKQFISDESHARVTIHPTGKSVPPAEEEVGRTHVVIYDGAEAFCKWANYFPRSNALIILDRTETQFLEGISQINARFMQRSKDFPRHFIGAVPPGLDAMGFLEAHR